MTRTRAGSAAAVVIAACSVGIGGCGGGDDGSSSATTTTAELPTITAPTMPTTDQSPTGAAPSATGSSSPDSVSANGTQLERVMAPFSDCLSRHGVQPSPLTGTSLRGEQLRNAQLVRTEIEAKIACVPELPRQLKEAGERFKRRFEQRQR